MAQPSHHSHNSSSTNSNSYGGKGLSLNNNSASKRQLISQQLAGGAAATGQDNFNHLIKDRNSQRLINGLSSTRHDQHSVRFTEKAMAAGNLCNSNDAIVVAVNAAKLNRNALEWALTNVVQPGDHILLIALWPVRKQWSLFSGECARRTIHLKKSSIKHIGKHLIDLEDEINDSCASMMEELHALCNDRKAKVSVKVLPDKEKGAIAAEAERVGASWVVLDKHVMKKEGKICLEKLQCNVVLVKQAMNSKILRLNLRGGVGISRRISSTAFPDISERKRKGNSKRRGKLNSSTTDSKRHYNGYYQDASTDQDVGSSGSCSPDHLYNAVGTPFTATGSETDNSAAVGGLRYNATNYDELLHRLGQALAAEDGFSDYGNGGGELDMEFSQGEDIVNGEHSSGLLCTPVTSPSPEALGPHKPLDRNRFLERAGDMAPESDDDDSVMDEQQRQPPPWLDNPYSSERVMISMYREVWKPALPYDTATSLISSSRAPSANTTPKSDTMTLTGSSYPRISRSPSPVPSSSSASIAPLSQPKQQTSALPTGARASRSPSPIKSGQSVNNQVSPIKATNTQSNSNTHIATGSVSRIRDSFVKCQKHGIKNSDAAQPSPDKSSLTGSKTVGRTESGRVITTRELLQRFSEWDHQGISKSQRMSKSNVASETEATNIPSSTSPLSETHASDRLSDADVRQLATPSSPLKYSGDQQQLDRASSVRRAMSIAGGASAAVMMQQSVLPGPPPLCSICQHKAPVFGKPPRRFTYAELEMATGGFSKANFLAEGGFGSVHRGILPDGQAVAVKQHKLASSQGDIEFCSEVEVLSCAQHRNVVMLIGYCIEEHRRLLVYEFICNGSLDAHLYGGDNQQTVLPWAARQKIAVGAARGLRYLHEECRVGCIIHRDMRPNNILLTHDYEPMVGDFGLARWQPDGDLGVQTRVIGTFGYLAPEYAQSGEVTEKADVYSFGVVLLELVTGRKAVDIGRPKGQQCLTEWARPLLEEGGNHTPLQDLVDPRLEGHYSQYELYCSLHAATLCIRKDPHLRPRMSQVLRILEGDVIIDTNSSSPLIPCSVSASAKASYNGSKSSRITGETSYRRTTDHNQCVGNGSSRRRAGSVSPPLVSYSGSILSGDGVSVQNQQRRIEKQLCHDAIRTMAEAYVKRLSFEGSA